MRTWLRRSPSPVPHPSVGSHGGDPTGCGIGQSLLPLSRYSRDTSELHMRVKIADLMGGDDVLFGTAMGTTCFIRLVGRAVEPVRPEVLFFDFAGVASATVSFLRDGPLAYRALLGTQRSKLCPVFANLTLPVRDSLGEYLSYTRDAAFGCELTSSGDVTEVQVLGRLDAKQELTFRAVRQLGEATAAQLASAHMDTEHVGLTAWNNRLAALTAKGLLVASRKGRSRTYTVTLRTEQWV